MIAFGSTEFKLGLATGDATDLFGRAVSIDGNYAAVGNSNDDSNGSLSGSVDIFRKVGDSWSFQTNLMPDISHPLMIFGVSVSLSGNYLIIGSLDNAGGTNSGAAFVFYRDGENWQQQAKLTPSDPAPQDHFGLSVAIDGDYAIIGSSYDDTWSTDAGSAYIFHRAGATWSQTQKLLASDGDYADHFGESVDISGNSIIVGASNNDQGADGSGAAFIFGFDGSSWSEESKIFPQDPVASKFFGKAVSIDGDYATAGAIWDAEYDTQAGAAYVFKKSNGTWSQQAKLHTSDYTRVDEFGFSLALFGSDLIVGSPYNDENGSQSGSVYHFVRTGQRWIQDAKYTDINGGNDHNYGWGVDLDGKTAIIGAPGADDAGAAFIRLLPPNTPENLVLTPGDGQVTLTWSQIADTGVQGYSVYGGSQPNPTTIIASNYSGVSDTTVTISGLSDTSRYYYYVRSRGLKGEESSVSEAVMISFGLRENKITAADQIDADNYGGKVALSDDYAVVAASSRDEYGENSGIVFVYHRTEEGWYQKAKLKASDASSGDYFGSSVALSDNYILVGAKEADNVLSRTGAAYLFYYDGQNWVQQAKLVASDAGMIDNFGISVDIDGDYAIIGATGDDDGGGIQAGAAYIFVKIDTVWTQQAKLLATDTEAYDYFGNAVAINGEYALIGVERDDGDASNTGSAYIFMRTGGTWSQQAKLTASDATGNDYFGNAVALDGNYAIIGAYMNGSGSAYIFQQDGSSWNQQAKLKAGDAESNHRFGTSVAILNDQVLIGAYQDDTPAQDCGAMYLFGRNGTNWIEQAKFTRTDAPTSSFIGCSVSLSPKYMMGGAYYDESAYIVDIPPFAPTELTLTPGSQQVTLSWNSSNESDFNSYKIFGDTLANPTVLFSTITDRLDTSVVISDLDDNQTYYFRFLATDNLGQSSNYTKSQIVAFGPRLYTLSVDPVNAYRARVSGDYMIVGATDNEGGVSAGAAHIFKKVNSAWIYDCKLIASDAASGDLFGMSVAIDGDYAVVGASYNDDSGQSSGSAYVFHRTESGWTEQAKLTASDAAEYHEFGGRVTIHGDYIGVGATWLAANAVYVFVRSSEVWTEQQKLPGGYNHTNDGSRIVIGSHRYNDDYGGAFVFERSGTTWTQTAILEASDAQYADAFGGSVSLDSNFLAIGAYGDDDLDNNSGAVYIFEYVQGSWVEQIKLLTSDGGYNDKFGGNVALEGENLIVSANNNTYHFARSGSEWVEQTALPPGGSVDIEDGYAIYKKDNYTVLLQKLALKAPTNIVAIPGTLEISLS